MTVLTLSELATRFDLELVGDGATAITGLCELSPGEPGKLGFLSSPQYRNLLVSTRAAVVVGKRDASALTTPGLVARDPSLAFARIARLFDGSRVFRPGVDASASIDASAQLGDGVHVGPRTVIEAGVTVAEGCYIGPGCILRTGSSLGAGSRLEAAVTICERVRIGARALIQPGAVIGARGFGNVRLPDGSWEEMPQLGTVVIGDDVEVGASTTIDRGALGDTLIGNGVRLDNQIQIAHNCVIGEHTAIAGSAGLAGSTTIGRRCLVGGAVNIGGHLHIADDVILLGRTMVTGSISEAGVYGSGLPHAPAREWRKTVARIRRLDKLMERVKHLEQLLDVKAQESAEPESGNDN
ncbi:MAG: UDP-3-O-(3-hydroxymyristoyl)glucosamine N-acyltransferase [Stagnimonas sp.]|nr:UDP-3-O-(3-hydroxymyristoyl)glucosamine N-acyltransferase [Stagnimonas sp.]